jgi:hypothetical protein
MKCSSVLRNSLLILDVTYLIFPTSKSGFVLNFPLPPSQKYFPRSTSGLAKIVVNITDSENHMLSNSSP